jgi:hypothetical protein
MEVVRLWLLEPDAMLRNVLTEFFTEELFAVQSCSSLREVCEDIRFRAGEAGLLVIGVDGMAASQDRWVHRTEAIDARAQELLTLSRLMPVLVLTTNARWQLHETSAPDRTYQVLANGPYDLDVLGRTARALSQRGVAGSPYLQGTF